MIMKIDKNGISINLIKNINFNFLNFDLELNIYLIQLFKSKYIFSSYFLSSNAFKNFSLFLFINLSHQPFDPIKFSIL